MSQKRCSCTWRRVCYNYSGIRFSGVCAHVWCADAPAQLSLQAHRLPASLCTQMEAGTNHSKARSCVSSCTYNSLSNTSVCTLYALRAALQHSKSGTVHPVAQYFLRDHSYAARATVGCTIFQAG